MPLNKSSLGKLTQIGSGGQATTYDAPDVALKKPKCKLVFKQYNKKTLSVIDVACIVSMRNHAVRLEDQRSGSGMELLKYCAWPVETVKESGKTVGFLMPHIPSRFFCDLKLASGIKNSEASFQLLLNNDSYLSARGIKLSDRLRFELLNSMASALCYLHEQGICVGDISPANVLFSLSPQPAVYFIDCDSMRFKGKSVTGQLETPDWDVRYLNPNEELGTIASDSYKLGLMALRLFARDQSTRDISRLPKTVPEPIRKLISSALSANPAMRPTPSSWLSPLAEAAKNASSVPSTVKQSCSGSSKKANPNTKSSPSASNKTLIATKGTTKPQTNKPVSPQASAVTGKPTNPQQPASSNQTNSVSSNSIVLNYLPLLYALGWIVFAIFEILASWPIIETLSSLANGNSSTTLNILPLAILSSFGSFMLCFASRSTKGINDDNICSTVSIIWTLVFDGLAIFANLSQQQMFGQMLSSESIWNAILSNSLIVLSINFVFIFIGYKLGNHICNKYSLGRKYYAPNYNKIEITTIIVSILAFGASCVGLYFLFNLEYFYIIFAGNIMGCCLLWVIPLIFVFSGGSINDMNVASAWSCVPLSIYIIAIELTLPMIGDGPSALIGWFLVAMAGLGGFALALHNVCDDPFAMILVVITIVAFLAGATVDISLLSHDINYVLANNQIEYYVTIYPVAINLVIGTIVTIRHFIKNA